LNKITELPSSAYSDEQTLLAAQRVAIFGFDPLIDIHSNRIVQEGGTSGAAGSGWVGYDPSADPGAWVVKSYEMSWPEYREVEIGVGQYRIDRSVDAGLTWTEFGVSSVVDCSRVSDVPGITAAREAKNAKPAPEPVLSIGGSEFNTAELLEALQLVRAKHAPAVKEMPRGLMVVREFDHRLGLWDGEGV